MKQVEQAVQHARVVREDDRYYPYPYRPGVGVGGGFGSSGWSSVGVGVSVPIGGGGYDRVERGAWTEARIPLPPAPRAIGPDWKIIVELTDSKVPADLRQEGGKIVVNFAKTA